MVARRTIGWVLAALPFVMGVALPPPAAGAVTGDWYVVPPLPQPDLWQIVQSGNQLTISSTSFGLRVGTIDLSNSFHLDLGVLSPGCPNSSIDGTFAVDENSFSAVVSILQFPSCQLLMDGLTGTRVAVGCGNGFLDAGEQCDDGNLTDGDGCDSNCTRTGCGNGIVTASEQCDDGNQLDGDACPSICLYSADFTFRITSSFFGNSLFKFVHDDNGYFLVVVPYSGARYTLGSSRIDPLTRAFYYGDLSGVIAADAASLTAVLNIPPPPFPPPFFGYHEQFSGTRCLNDPVHPQDACITPPPNAAGCGNGVLDLGEQCDDGNTSDGDLCPADCKYTLGKTAIRGNHRTPSKDHVGCLAEWYVASAHTALDSFGLASWTQSCMDQDPSCDFDPTPGRCRFDIALCVNNESDDLACAPNVSSVRVMPPQRSHLTAVNTAMSLNAARLNGILHQLHDPSDIGGGYTYEATSGRTNLCGATSLDVLAQPTKAQTFNLTVNSHHSRLRLRCLPRPLP